MPRLKGKDLADAAKKAYDDAQDAIYYSDNKAYSWAAIGAVVGVTMPMFLGMGMCMRINRKNWDNRNNYALITHWAQAARATHLGNCQEYTSIAFEHLRTRGIGPIDWIELTDGDHAVCVLGRPAGTDATNASTWGAKDIWVIDGWNQECFEMSEAGKFGKIVGKHKYDLWVRVD